MQANGEQISPALRKRDGSSSNGNGSRRLRIAMLAPPWIPVPPPAYGGIEHVIALLCEELTRRGHAVTLFAPPGSKSPATVQSPLDAPHENEIGTTMYEADHVAVAFSA